MAIAEHTVAPFTAGMVAGKLESSNGLFWGELRVEAGVAWHSRTGWRPDASAEATIERVVLAINDRPLSLVAGVRYDSLAQETIARVGIRMVIVQHPDQRVTLHALDR